MDQLDNASNATAIGRVLLKFATIVGGLIEPMRKSQINEVLKTLDNLFSQIGAESFDEAVRVVEGASKGDTPEQKAVIKIAHTVASYIMQDLGGITLQQGLEELARLPTRQAMEQALQKADDLSSEDLILLAKLKATPVQLRKSLAKMTSKVKPKGGPPVLVPKSEYSKICSEITALIGAGRTTGQAKAKVASLRKCSVSTINTAWRSRRDEL